MARSRPRQRAAAVLALLVGLAACGGPKPEIGEVGNVSGFLGGAVTEEPHAAIVARDVLSAGGTAADAAAAAALTMTVTYPVGAGLGGGGVCIYYDAVLNSAEVLDFLPVPARDGGAVAVPGALRGIALLHSRYGRMRWGQLVSPAEKLARFGFPVSRALAKRLQANRARLASVPALARLFLKADGTPLGEGETVVQVELASLLARVRSRGVGEFYGGEAGSLFVDDARPAGSRIEVEDLRAYRAQWHAPDDRTFGSHLLHHPADGDGGTAVYALTGRAAGEAAVDLAAYASAAGSDPLEAGDAALVVGDRQGSAAACMLTMLRPFGIGAVTRTGGLLLSEAPATPPQLGVVIAANHNTDQTFLAAAGGGGLGGVQAVAQVAQALLTNGGALQGALAAPRRLQLGGGNVVAETPGDNGGTKLGRVQALWCPEGLKRRPDLCAFVSDPRGFGLAAGQVH